MGLASRYQSGPDAGRGSLRVVSALPRPFAAVLRLVGSGGVAPPRSRCQHERLLRPPVTYSVPRRAVWFASGSVHSLRPSELAGSCPAPSGFRRPVPAFRGLMVRHHRYPAGAAVSGILWARYLLFLIPVHRDPRSRSITPVLSPFPILPAVSAASASIHPPSCAGRLSPLLLPHAIG